MERVGTKTVEEQITWEMLMDEWSGVRRKMDDVPSDTLMSLCLNETNNPGGVAAAKWFQEEYPKADVPHVPYIMNNSISDLDNMVALLKLEASDEAVLAKTTKAAPDEDLIANLQAPMPLTKDEAEFQLYCHAGLHGPYPPRMRRFDSVESVD